MTNTNESSRTPVTITGAVTLASFRPKSRVVILTDGGERYVCDLDKPKHFKKGQRITLQGVFQPAAQTVFLAECEAK